MFSVMPTGQEFNLESGKIYTGKITIINSSNAEGDFNYQVSAAPYNVIGEDYDVDLATKSNHSMMSEWITISSPTGSLKPGEQKEVEFIITVPESAPAGGQYASILVTENNQNYSSGSTINGVFEIASLVYASVAGETYHSGEILENNVPGFVMSTPISVGSLLVNNGNVHESAITLLQVKNSITGEVILSKDQNGGRYSEAIIPETMRRTDYKIDNLPAVGVVEVTQTVYYGGETSVETKNVVICPLWFMAVVAILIGVIVSIIVIKMKKRRLKKSVI